MADPDTLPWVEAQVRTDAEGAWKAEGLEPGDEVAGRPAPSGAADVKTSVAVVAGVVDPGRRLDPRRRARVIAGRVEWADGKPIAGARVFAKTMKKPASFTVESAADGSFRLVGPRRRRLLRRGVHPGDVGPAGAGQQAGRRERPDRRAAGRGAHGQRGRRSRPAPPIAPVPLTPVFTDEQDWMAELRRTEDRQGARRRGLPVARRRVSLRPPEARPLHAPRRGGRLSPDRLGAGRGGRRARRRSPPTVELPDGNRIAGFVRDATGAPIADAKIVIVSFEDLGVSTPNSSGRTTCRPGSRERPEETRTDEKGAFRTEAAHAARLSARGRQEGVHVECSSTPSMRRPSRSRASSSASIHRAPWPSASAIRAAVRSSAPPSCSSTPRGASSGWGAGRAGSRRSPTSDRVRGRPSTARARSRGSSSQAAGRGTARRSTSAHAPRPARSSSRVEARGKTEVELRVSARTRIEGRVRLGAHKPAQRWFYVQREDGGIHEWVAFEEDGSFVDPVDRRRSLRRGAPSRPRRAVPVLGRVGLARRARGRRQGHRDRPLEVADATARCVRSSRAARFRRAPVPLGRDPDVARGGARRRRRAFGVGRRRRRGDRRRRRRATTGPSRRRRRPERGSVERARGRARSGSPAERGRRGGAGRGPALPPRGLAAARRPRPCAIRRALVDPARRRRALRRPSRPRRAPPAHGRGNDQLALAPHRHPHRRSGDLRASRRVRAPRGLRARSRCSRTCGSRGGCVARAASWPFATA